MTPDLAGAAWRKSSRSGVEGGNCVEVVAGVRAVRDSKNPAAGALRLGEGAAAAFMTAVKAGTFDA
ncbi:DUF397 domain-containing protein [Lentzea albida]|uniref:DUF397 domain-containing protein n=1 Tax=Lentzea albida TaxID=65499 RepID=A0A1H9VGM4_9PSEU|nr:DUF397 domain-containing protein [Lentzea albida]SES20701.1 protein of unknown function [Lentzea albida]